MPKSRIPRDLGEPEAPAVQPFSALAAAGYGLPAAAGDYGLISTPEGFRFRSFTMTRIGLSAPDSLALDDWEAVGGVLGRIEGALQWWIGDWMALGNKAWGIKYERAMEITGLSYKYLRNIASVTRKYQLSSRKDNLSFAHHLIVASLHPDRREALLNQALEHAWTTAQLSEAATPRSVPTEEYKTHQRVFKDILKAIKSGDGRAVGRKHLEALHRLVAQIERSLDERNES